MNIDNRMYIFYLIIKIAVRQAIIALLPKIKSEFKEYIIKFKF